MTAEILGSKTCKTCGLAKPLDQFHRKNGQASQRRRAHCGKCEHERRKLRLTPEQIEAKKAQRRDHYLANRTRLIAYAKVKSAAYVKANPEKIAAYRVAYQRKLAADSKPYRDAVRAVKHAATLERQSSLEHKEQKRRRDRERYAAMTPDEHRAHMLKCYAKEKRNPEALKARIDRYLARKYEGMTGEQRFARLRAWELANPERCRLASQRANKKKMVTLANSYVRGLLKMHGALDSPRVNALIDAKRAQMKVKRKICEVVNSLLDKSEVTTTGALIKAKRDRVFVKSLESMEKRNGKTDPENEIA